MSGQYYNNGAPPSPKCGPVYHMIASDVYPPSPKEMYGTGVYDTIQVRNVTRKKIPPPVVPIRDPSTQLSSNASSVSSSQTSLSSGNLDDPIPECEAENRVGIRQSDKHRVQPTIAQPQKSFKPETHNKNSQKTKKPPLSKSFSYAPDLTFVLKKARTRSEGDVIIATELTCPRTDESDDDGQGIARLTLNEDSNDMSKADQKGIMKKINSDKKASKAKYSKSEIDYTSPSLCGFSQPAIIQHSGISKPYPLVSQYTDEISASSPVPPTELQTTKHGEPLASGAGRCLTPPPLPGMYFDKPKLAQAAKDGNASSSAQVVSKMASQTHSPSTSPRTQRRHVHRSNSCNSPNAIHANSPNGNSCQPVQTYKVPLTKPLRSPPVSCQLPNPADVPPSPSVPVAGVMRNPVVQALQNGLGSPKQKRRNNKRSSSFNYHDLPPPPPSCQDPEDCALPDNFPEPPPPLPVADRFLANAYNKRSPSPPIPPLPRFLQKQPYDISVINQPPNTEMAPPDAFNPPPPPPPISSITSRTIFSRQTDAQDRMPETMLLENGARSSTETDFIIPNLISIPDNCPPWKRDMLERKNREIFAEYQKKMSEQLEEEEKWRNIPIWKRQLMKEREQKKKDGQVKVNDSEPPDMADTTPQSLPNWKQELLFKKTQVSNN